MQAIILAGGKGERMRPFTDYYPKPMVPLLGKPLICHQIVSLKENGIKDIAVYESHLPKSIQEYLSDGKELGVNVEHRVSDFDLGSVGVIADALSKLEKGEDALVLYGDIFSDIDIKTLISEHRKERPYGTVAMIERKHPFGVAKTRGNIIESFEEKPTFYENAGIFAVAQELGRHLPERGDFFTAVQKLIISGLEFRVFNHEGYWWDVRSLDVVEEIERHFNYEGTVKREYAGTANKER